MVEVSFSIERYHLSRMFLDEKLVAWVKVVQEFNHIKVYIYRDRMWETNKSPDIQGVTYHLQQNFTDPESAMIAGEAEVWRLQSIGWKMPWEEVCPECGKLIPPKDKNDIFDKVVHSKVKSCEFRRQQKLRGIE